MNTTHENPYADTSLASAYEEGFDRGDSVASWIDLPEIGQTLDRSIDLFGVGTIEDENDVAEAFSALAGEAEANSRQYSPFEFTAHELNEREDSEEAWEAFDAGIAAGIAHNFAKRTAALA